MLISSNPFGLADCSYNLYHKLTIIIDNIEKQPKII